MQKLMTAILNDGSQITGVEVSETINGDEIVLSCDGQEVPINRLFIMSYYAEVDPIGFETLDSDEAEALDGLCDLSALLQHQAY